MAEVIPFKGIFYNTETVSADDVTAPPYDIITSVLREELYKKSPYNIVRVDSGKDLEKDTETDNKYTRAKTYLRQWLEEGILKRSETPCFYAYEMLYTVRSVQKRLTGFYGLVRLEELGKGIYPHECTHSKPKHDRLALLKESSANTSPIFALYRSPEKKASSVLDRAIKEQKPYMEAKDMDGAVHRLWFISDTSSINAIKADLEDKAVFIADGHHRYETALEYQKSMHGAKGDEPFNYVLMFLANIAEDGLTILPAHRLINVSGDIIKKLSGYFSIEELPSDADISNTISGQKHTFGLSIKGNRYILRYRGNDLKDIQPVLRKLDVVILDEMILKRLLNVPSISYEMDAGRAQAEVEGGGYAAAFFLNSTTVMEVEEVAVSFLRMPPKSTYFYPKLLTGFVINSLKNSL
ncbi:MAG: DUF1015 domain-containing protein [Nitrospirae bacterium]|nr:DUF1015 domain-containing protein [Nitrospirota bacterium]